MLSIDRADIQFNIHYRIGPYRLLLLSATSSSSHAIVTQFDYVCSSSSSLFCEIQWAFFALCAYIQKNIDTSVTRRFFCIASKILLVISRSAVFISNSRIKKQFCAFQMHSKSAHLYWSASLALFFRIKIIFTQNYHNNRMKCIGFTFNCEK